MRFHIHADGAIGLPPSVGGSHRVPKVVKSKAIGSQANRLPENLGAFPFANDELDMGITAAEELEFHPEKIASLFDVSHIAVDARRHGLRGNARRSQGSKSES
jgi:hypothetical protein